MASSTQQSPALNLAKPTVRLKGKENEFRESEKFLVFQNRGGKDEELMDEQRWLDYKTESSKTKWLTLPESPKYLHPTWNVRGDSRDQNLRTGKSVIWNPAIEGGQDSSAKQVVRSSTEKHLMFEILSRACKEAKNKGRDIKRFLGLSVSTTPVSRERRIHAVFVGVSAFDCQPIFMVRDSTESTTTSDELLETDNTAPCDLSTLSRELSHGHDVIWIENMLIQGNISYVKRGLHSFPGTSHSREFSAIVRREHSFVEVGLGTAGTAMTLPSSEVQERKPMVCRPIHDGKRYDTLHYQLRWPPMALLEFPSEMVAAMKYFLGFHPSDNIPLNLALAATIIYFDLEKSYGHEREGFVRFFTSKTFCIKKAPLGMFIIYFPHMLRFVENKHLTAFIHPSRFALYHHSRDTEGGDEDFKVSSNRARIDTADMRDWYLKIRSRYPQVPSTFRFHLVPASMPGSSMVFPQDIAEAARPTSDLFTLACLDDIRTLGLPSYHYRAEDDDTFRYIGGPQWLFSSRMSSPSSEFHGVPSACYWNVGITNTITALTGLAREIGSVFPDVGSEYYDTQFLASRVERCFGAVKAYTQNFQLCEDLDAPLRESIATRADELNRIADRLGIPSSERWTSHETLCPEWRGMEAHLESLLAEGKLKRFAEPEQAMTPAKRAKLPDPLLDSEVKDKILSILNGLKTKSSDWDSFEEQLQTPQPTVKAIQQSFSQVKSFVSDLEETLRPENAENGQGSLDQVIRMAFRAEGLLDRTISETLEYKSRWDQHLDRFVKFGRTTRDAMETIFRLRDTPDGFRLILSIIQTLKESPLIKDQLEASKKINALLSPPRPVIKLKTSSRVE
ncbi:uncharacterized protein FMAN_03370 [Fusarium mangiferae]|uniref:Uncharacterized protein n=1 Tax=Fusarium mangiferae TaxID=192010 RepID=A0A1L7TBI7_FUSMA|nr:uncharacterized protein FMAN_03370 [Fusarium mangiferae]CVK94152.1 uncharacterized protein FMAN_03370 [Fusarium mangiferae]